MATVGNQGQDDRYIRLWRHNISLPVVSRSCDCHVFDKAFLSTFVNHGRKHGTIGLMFLWQTIRQV